MCNRICLSRTIDEIRNHFAVAEGRPRLTPHWNIAPGALLPVIRWWGGAIGTRRLDLMRWGLVAAWAQNIRVVRASIHVRDEPGDLALRLRYRCLVPADNFYEWRRADNQPFAVAFESRKIMALAGIWDFRFSPSGEQIACFALLTTTSSTSLAPLAPRMPVLVRPEDWDLWLSPYSAMNEIHGLMQSVPDEPLEIWPVDRRLSSSRNDSPDLLESVER